MPSSSLSHNNLPCVSDGPWWWWIFQSARWGIILDKNAWLHMRNAMRKSINILTGELISVYLCPTFFMHFCLPVNPDQIYMGFTLNMHTQITYFHTHLHGNYAIICTHKVHDHVPSNGITCSFTMKPIRGHEARVAVMFICWKSTMRMIIKQLCLLLAGIMIFSCIRQKLLVFLQKPLVCEFSQNYSKYMDCQEIRKISTIMKGNTYAMRVLTGYLPLSPAGFLVKRHPQDKQPYYWVGNAAWARKPKSDKKRVCLKHVLATYVLPNKILAKDLQINRCISWLAALQ